MNHTKKIQAALWQCYGNPNYPAEWDGKVYGGGKLSQRFWEYHAAIDLLELTPDSVVLDIGGGSPVTGAGFFTRVIAPFVREVHVLDMNIKKENKAPANIKFHPQLGSRTALLKLFQDNPQITHVACISVFEHIPHEVRCGMVQAINEAFAGNIFVTTLEYHPKDRFFEHQLTTQTMSEMLGALTRFYPDSMHKSPFWCDNAYRDPSLGRGLLRRLGIHLKKETEVPLWYPVALRFRSTNGAQQTNQ